MLKITYAGCLDLSPDFFSSAQFTLEMCVAASNRENFFTKTPILGFKVIQASRSSILVPPESSSAVSVMMRSKSVSICNHSRARLVDGSSNRAFWRGTEMWCARTEDPFNLRGSNLTPLKSTFNGEYFVRRLSWPILNDFGPIQSWLMEIWRRSGENNFWDTV